MAKFAPLIQKVLEKKEFTADNHGRYDLDIQTGPSFLILISFL